MRLIDADALMERIKDMKGISILLDGLETAEALVDVSPTIDAVPIVRCKDCKAAQECPNVLVDGALWCNEWETVVDDNGYCYQAEKKEEGADDERKTDS